MERVLPHSVHSCSPGGRKSGQPLPGGLVSLGTGPAASDGSVRDSWDGEKGGKEGEEEAREPAEDTQGCLAQAVLTRELISWMDRKSGSRSSSRGSRLGWRGQRLTREPGMGESQGGRGLGLAVQPVGLRDGWLCFSIAQRWALPRFLPPPVSLPWEAFWPRPLVLHKSIPSNKRDRLQAFLRVSTCIPARLWGCFQPLAKRAPLLESFSSCQAAPLSGTTKGISADCAARA